MAASGFVDPLVAGLSGSEDAAGLHGGASQKPKFHRASSATAGLLNRPSVLPQALGLPSLNSPSLPKGRLSPAGSKDDKESGVGSRFVRFLDAQMNEMHSRLKTEFQREIARLESEMKVLEETNGRLRKDLAKRQIESCASPRRSKEKRNSKTRDPSLSQSRSATAKSAPSQVAEGQVESTASDDEVTVTYAASGPPKVPQALHDVLDPPNAPEESPVSMWSGKPTSGTSKGKIVKSLSYEDADFDPQGGKMSSQGSSVVKLESRQSNGDALAVPPHPFSVATSNSDGASSPEEEEEEASSTEGEQSESCTLGDPRNLPSKGLGATPSNDGTSSIYRAFNVLPEWAAVAGEGGLVGARSSNQTATMSRKGSFTNLSNVGEVREMNKLEVCMGKYMQQPSSKFNFVWELVGLLLVVRDIIVIPLQILDPLDSLFMNMLTWMARLFWTFDIVVSFFTGFVTAQGDVMMKPGKVAKKYMRTRLPMDLLIVGCDWSEVAMTGSTTGWNFFGMLRAMRLFRLSRLIKNQQKILEFMIRSEGLMLVASVQACLLLLLALIHLLACIWYGIVTATEEFAYRDGGPLSGNLGSRYIFCFHTILALFLGEHVVLPENPGERIFTVTVLFFAFVVSAAFVGSLTTAMTRLQIIASQRSAQFAALSNFLSDYGISRDLALRVQRNARHALNEQKRNTPESSVTLLGVISDQLKAEIHYEVHSKDLMVHPFFRIYNEVTPICMRFICHSAIMQLSLSAGDIVFADFEVPSMPRMFFVNSGRLLYTHCFKNMEEEIEPGFWLAEAVLWTQWVHRGTAQVAQDCRITELYTKNFTELVKMYRSPSRSTMKYAASFVESLNKLNESDLTDIGEDLEASTLAENIFVDDNATIGSSSRMVSARMSRRQSNFNGIGVDSFMSSIKRQSLMMSPARLSVQS